MRSLLLLSLALIPFLGFSQEAQVEWGEFTKESSRFYGKEILCENDGRVYMYKKRNRDINLLIMRIPRKDALFVSVHDAKNYSKITESEIIIPKKELDKKAHFELHSILKLDGKLLLFIEGTHKKNKNSKLYVQELDKDGKQVGKFKQIASIKGSEGKGLFNSKKAGSMSIVTSPDEKKFAIIMFDGKDRKSIKETKQKVDVIRMTSSLNDDWKGTIELPFKDEFFAVEDYRIGNKDEFYLLGKKWKTVEKKGSSGKSKTKRKKGEKGDANFTYDFVSFQLSKGDYKIYPIDLKGKYITDVAFNIAEKAHVIVCAGFYSKLKGGTIGGTFSMAIDLDSKKVKYNNSKDFSKKFIALFLSKRKAKRLKKGKEKEKDLELYNFDLDNFVIRPDGSAFLMAEQFTYYQNARTINQNGVMITVYDNYYIYKHIIVIHMNPKGGIEWYARIPKAQKTVNDGGAFSSYLMDVTDKKLFFVFNDHPDNLELLKEGKYIKYMSSPYKSNAVVVSLDYKGNMDRKVLYLRKDEKIYFKPNASWYKRDENKSDEVFILGLKKSLFSKPKFKLGKIKF